MSLTLSPDITFSEFKNEVLNDYALACLSRETSLLGRKEVLTGKAKFGIFGDGKELPQIALSKQFKNGDWRSGYYRDQTLMMAIGNLTVQQFFAQLYAHTDINFEPMSGGRQMNGHYATRYINENGTWKDLMQMKNVSADVSPTACQMLRALGLAQASTLFRKNESLHQYTTLSNKGNEVCFATIGDASTSEGYFWESINAAAVLQVPLVVSVWDDGYGISVPKKFQTAKQSISEALAGMTDEDLHQGIDIYTVNAWDYAALIETYQIAVEKCRQTQKPCLIHVEECTQPQGHSTSGSHERYKNQERLQWEKDYDCITQFRKFIIENNISDENTLDQIALDAKQKAKEGKQAAWEQYQNAIKKEINLCNALLDELIAENIATHKITNIKNGLNQSFDHFHSHVIEALQATIRACVGLQHSALNEVIELHKHLQKINTERFQSYLIDEGNSAFDKTQITKPSYDEVPESLNGYEILNKYFDYVLENNNKVLAFGEDVGHIGDVNQGFMGLQAKHGVHRVMDTGIREATIMGQAIGLAMRGLRPIAEIQYLDYLIYGLQVLSDDAATLRYRTKNGQAAPIIIRTRGHRLEGIWHTGSPMGMLINSVRGMHVCVPRNMVQAAGMYQHLLQLQDPAIVIECLNGYRLKENLPNNLGTYTVALGEPEILIEGSDITLITYGSSVRIAEKAIQLLHEYNIQVELIDVQTLLPFDVKKTIVDSVKKTNRVVFLDEDVPSGATAYMMQQVLEIQGAYQYLDSPPVCISAAANRAAYGSDGDYFCKPSVDKIFETLYNIMHQAEPGYYPSIF